MDIWEGEAPTTNTCTTNLTVSFLPVKRSTRDVVNIQVFPSNGAIDDEVYYVI